MYELTQQVFKLLKIKPYQYFKIKGINNYKFYFAENLNIYCIIEENKAYDTRLFKETEKVSLKSILSGTHIIDKIIPKISREERIAIEYARLCGLKWLAKDKDGTVIGFSDKPLRNTNSWFKNNYTDDSMTINVPISFLSWDNDPYYIGDDD
jgi:hypothetical protein